jgi:hypothetical protein
LIREILVVCTLKVTRNEDENKEKFQDVGTENTFHIYEKLFRTWRFSGSQIWKKKNHLLHLQTVYIADMWRSKLSFNKLKNTKPTINMGRIPVLSPVQVLALRTFSMGGCSRAEKSIGLFLHLLCLLCWLLNIQNAYYVHGDY